MNKRALFWQFFGAHTLILFAAVCVVAFYTWRTGHATFHRQWVRELETQAKLLAELLPSEDGRLDEKAATEIVARLAPMGESRFTVILPDGRVIGDTSADTRHMDRHSDRVEVREALQNGAGMSERYSETLGKTMLYLAQRAPPEGPARAVVRVAAPLNTITREMARSERPFLALIGAILLVSFVLSYGAARRIIGPVAELKNGLARIGGGELTCRLRIPPVPHLADLAREINRTAESLQRQMQAVREERNLRTLILDNMTRGVIAVDAERRIMDVNAAARHLLRLARATLEGVRIGEAARYPELLALIEASEKTAEPVEKEMSVENGEEKLLNLRATALRDTAGARIGTLVVLSDVTLLRHLETVRQDFVANVSHELRTPVTSIKGFAETLLEGAMKDPATAERFLKIIARQAGQLDSIIRDLLELSRLEQHSAKALERPLTPVAGVLKNAVELCQTRAAERGYKIAVACEEGLAAPMHAGLMEQAVINLIDNAIKYGATSEHPTISVRARRDGGCVRVEVRDEGNGIERAHLERLFERFYRVDKGRSREMGGTGLGLAIVKHIALIHGGAAAVASEPGRGATFTITLPGGYAG